MPHSVDSFYHATSFDGQIVPWQPATVMFISVIVTDTRCLSPLHILIKNRLSANMLQRFR